MAIALMQQDKDYHDLEDTIQYVLARQAGCTIILSNDAKFVAKDINVISSTAWLANQH